MRASAVKNSSASGGGKRRRARPLQSRFAGENPTVQQRRMIHQKRRHAKPGRISDPQRAAVGGRKTGGVWIARARQMLDPIDGERAREPHREQFGLKRRPRAEARASDVAVGQAEFAVAVNRGRAHKIADFEQKPSLRLQPRRQAIDAMRKQARASIRARQRQLARGVSPRLLARRVAGEAIQIGGRRIAVEKREGGVPSGCDDAVGAKRGGQIARERDKRKNAPVAALGAIHGAPDSARIEGEQRARKSPFFRAQPPQQRAHKTQSRLVKRAQTRKAHHKRRRAQRDADGRNAGARGHRPGANPARKKRSQLPPNTPPTSLFEKPAAASPRAKLSKSAAL